VANSMTRITNEAIGRYFSELQFRLNIYDKAKKDMHYPIFLQIC
jgi:hypothetical protein